MLRMGIAEKGRDGRTIDVALGYGADTAVRNLSRNELLFEAGDIKTKIYRVETGALCIYRTRPDLTIEIVEHVLAGDLLRYGLPRSAFGQRARHRRNQDSMLRPRCRRRSH